MTTVFVFSQLVASFLGLVNLLWFFLAFDGASDESKNKTLWICTICISWVVSCWMTRGLLQ